MLILAKSMKDLRFGELMNVYRESNLENGRLFYPALTEGQQIIHAEADFYQYLREVFFPVPGSVCCIWQEASRYVSALRLEPYKDGLLLEALETALEHRRLGFAEKLLRAVLEAFPENKIYSHVNKHNLPSLGIHEKCGFRRVLEHAVYVDGSVNRRSCTLLHE